MHETTSSEWILSHNRSRLFPKIRCSILRVAFIPDSCATLRTIKSLLYFFLDAESDNIAHVKIACAFYRCFRQFPQ